MENTLYTHGLFRCSERYVEFPTVSALYEKIVADAPWKPTNKDFKKYADTWKAINFRIGGVDNRQYMEAYPDIRPIIDSFKCEVNTIAFYRAEPGLKLHPHIDLSGHLGFNRLRFHIPVKTNAGAIMIMGGANSRAFHLATGEMWALDTSHQHAVENSGSEERVHLMVEVRVNQWVRAMLPRRNFRFYAHMAGFFLFHVPKAIVRRRMAKFGLIKKVGYE